MLSESQFHDAISHAKTCYETKLVNDFARDRNSKIYSYIKSISRQDQLPPQMFHESISAVSDKDKANLFNRYFFSVYSSNSSSISLETTPPPPHSSISDLHFCHSDVYVALTKLDPLKAMGIDGIGPKILRHCACALSHPILHLFQVSLSHSQLPSELAIITNI